MASTITLTGDWLVSLGNRRQTSGTGNLGTYAANGIAVSASQVGLGVIDTMLIYPAGGYTFEYVASSGKVKAYRAGATTPVGTISAPSLTVKTGTIGANMTIGLTADAVTASVVGGTGITADRTLTTNNPISAPVFTGTAGTAAALAEVGTVDLSGITFTFVAVGR